MPAKIRPFLMFEGQAEEALNFYVSLFPGNMVTELVRYGPEGPGAEGTVMKASFSLGDQTVRCFDSPIKHAFTFTPAFSWFVECQSEEEIRRLFSALSEHGAVLMELSNYGFSRQFGWVNDRFGVSWQLNWA